MPRSGAPKVEKLKARGNITGLIDILNHKDWWEREASAKALGEIENRQAVEPLITRLKEEESIPVILEIVRALGRIGDPGAVEPLVDLFNGNENPRVQEESALVLKQIGLNSIRDKQTQERITGICEKKIKEEELRLSWEKKSLQRKAEVKVMEDALDEERKRLTSAGLIREFVKDRNGVWDHSDWLEFLGSVRNAGFTTISEDEVGQLLETEKQNHSHPCEICKQYPAKSFSFYIAKYILLDSKTSGTILFRTRTYTYTYRSEGSKQVWICDDCLAKEGFRSARSNMGCSIVGSPIAITIVWAAVAFFLSGAVRSDIAKYLCIVPLALVISAFFIFLLITYIKDFVGFKRDANYHIKYSEQFRIGENLAIKLHKQALQKQGLTCFTPKEWARMVKKKDRLKG